MNIEKIEIKPGQYVWVDKDAEIKEGELFAHYWYDDTYSTKRNYKRIIVSTANANIIRTKNRKSYIGKIIAASPELNLKDVPTYVEWLADEYSKNKSSSSVFAEAHKRDFIKGYQTAALELFTKEDVIFAIQEAYGHGQNDEFDGLNKIEESIKSIIDFLKKKNYETNKNIR